jgi:hypothetical protein
MRVQIAWAAAASPGPWASEGDLDITVAATEAVAGNTAPRAGEACADEVQSILAGPATGATLSVSGGVDYTNGDGSTGAHTFRAEDLFVGWAAPFRSVSFPRLFTPTWVQRPDYRQPGFSVEGALHGWAGAPRGGVSGGVLPVSGMVVRDPVTDIQWEEFAGRINLEHSLGPGLIAGGVFDPTPRFFFSRLTMGALHPVASSGVDDYAGELQTTPPGCSVHDERGAGFRDRLRLPAFSFGFGDLRRRVAGVLQPVGSLPDGWSSLSVDVAWTDLDWEVDRVYACPAAP